MKRISAFMLFLFMLLFNFTVVFATNNTNNEAEEYKIELGEFEVECESAILMEAETGEILYSFNENKTSDIASVTKVMTLLLVMEAIDEGSISLADIVSVSAYASSMGGSQVFLEEGERISVEELLKCTIIASGNDSAVALAEHTAGSEDAFVRRMNERAKALGLSGSVFENVTGLDDTTTNHSSTAYDIAIISRELIKYPLILKYSSLWQDTIRNGEFTLTNTNRLVRYYDGCNGLKTGSTDKAGFCISTTAKRNDMQLIAVVLGAKTRDIRNKVARELLDFGFANYSLYKSDECEIEKVPLSNAKIEETIVYKKPFFSIVNKRDLSRVNFIYEIPEVIVAPVLPGEAIGSVKYMVDDKLLGKTDIFIKEKIDKIEFLDIIVKIFNTIIGIETKKI